MSPFPSLSPLQRVQQVFLFHHNLLKERPTQEELNIERYKSTSRYSPHIPPTNTATINLQLHTLLVATPKIISSYQNVDNLIKAFKNDITYDDPDSIYPALCMELEKITPKYLTTSIAPTTTATTTLVATTTSSTRTGICFNVLPASMIFQAQPEESINTALEEDSMVQDITTQPRLEPLPASSAFQPQKNFLEALDLEIFAHCVDYHDYQAFETSYEDYMRSYRENIRNSQKKVRFALMCSMFFQIQNKSKTSRGFLFLKKLRGFKKTN